MVCSLLLYITGEMFGCRSKTRRLQHEAQTACNSIKKFGQKSYNLTAATTHVFNQNEKNCPFELPNCFRGVFCIEARTFLSHNIFKM